MTVIERMMQTQEAPVSYSKLFKLYSIMAHVAGAVDLTPRMRRVTLGGDGLRSLIGQLHPADAVKLYLPATGQAAPHTRLSDFSSGRKAYHIRPYTIRSFRSAAPELDIDVLLHGDSRGSVWARSVQPGDAVGLIGPRHDYHGAHGADWQVLAGDESALPAIAAILEQLPAQARATALIEVDDEAGEVPVELGANAEIRWLHRRGAPAKDSTLLEAALRGLNLPDGRGYCWVAGNSAVVHRIRHLLHHDWRLAKDQMFTMGYWR